MVNSKMFPFRTNRFSFFLEISNEELERRLNNYYKIWKFLRFSKHQKSKAVVDGNIMDFELSEVPSRNTFRPVIVFEWQDIQGRTFIQGYYRLSKNLMVFSVVYSFAATICALQAQSVYLLFFLIVLWIVFFQILGYLLYRKEIDWVKNIFERMIHGSLPFSRASRFE